MRKSFLRTQPLWLACIVVAASLGLGADTPISPDALMKHIRYLASDDLGGRGNGTPGLERAGDYVADQFRAVGLEPGGDAGGWFQPFEIVTGLTVGDGNRLTIRARARAVSFDIGDSYYPLAATANETAGSTSASLSGTPLVFAGYGISAPDLQYDDYAGVDVKDKAVLIFTHEPQEHDASSRFNGTQFTKHTLLMEKAMAARTRGARVLIAVSDPTHDGDAGGYAGFKREPQAEDYGIPVLRVERSRLAPILDAWGLDDLARQIDLDLEPRSRPLDGSTVDYVEQLARTRRTVRNVVGILRGNDPARRHEAIVVGAHYDHLGLGGRHSMNPDLAGQIHNGADDNASGTAAVIEIARSAAASRARFDRTLVFVAFAGEELGLLGSTHYVRQPALPLEQTIAMINLDMVGRAQGKVMVSGLDAAPALVADLDGAAAAVPGLDARRFQEGAGVGSSDDTSFAVKKIPAIGFFSGFHADYHRPTDDSDRIDAEGAARVATLAFELAARVADRAARPEFVTPPPPSHGSSTAGGDPGSVGGYGPYFGSIPDMSADGDGVTFAEVREHSPAGQAGLRGGDVLVAFGGKPIRTLIDFTFALRAQKPGDAVEVQVQRDGTTLTATVRLTTRP